MTTFTKWLATKYSFNTQPTALECTILSDGFRRVSGAAWCKAAILAKKRAENQLICANNGEKNFVHGYGFNDLLAL